MAKRRYPISIFRAFEQEGTFEKVGEIDSMSEFREFVKSFNEPGVELFPLRQVGDSAALTKVEVLRVR